MLRPAAEFFPASGGGARHGRSTYPTWEICMSQPAGEPAAAAPVAAPAAPAVAPAVPAAPAPLVQPAVPPVVPVTGPTQDFPADTPVAEMTPPQQAAYHKAQSRRWEERAKARGDYDDLKAKAEQYDALVTASQTEHERAVAEARTEADKAARADVTSKFTARLVEAEIKAAAAGRLTDPQLQALLPTLNHAAFLNAENEPDADKVSALVQSLTPAAPQTRTATDLGQGRRATPAATGTAAGRALYAERHPQKTAT